MARLRALTPGQQANVADSLGQFIADGAPSFGAAAATLSLRENFPVLSLSAAVMNDDIGDLREFLEDTGTQLHQVARNGRPVGYSISRALDATRPVIDQYTQTGDAAAIAATIAQIDASDIPDSYEACIIDIRALDIGAIVLVDNNAAPTLVAPFRVPLHQERLRQGAIYTSIEFRSALRTLRRGGGFVPGP